MNEHEYIQNAANQISDAVQLIGKGNSAKVYVDPKYPSLCYKIIHNGYNVNTPEVEAEFLDKVDSLISRNVKTPKTEATFFFEYPENENNRRCSALVMERIFGMSLQEIVEQQRFPKGAEPQNFEDFNDMKKSFHEVRDFIREINSQYGIYHNDLFLRNLMLDRDKKWWVIDFGEAKKEYFQQDIRNGDIETLKNTWNSFAEFVGSYIERLGNE